ncbi:MAG: DUF2971 domain-containing protein [Candidatus Gastranaerophilales bacterium]|nr:DUF2971 domain-containing protein [Candidatus Gastranaerophilales bacterium]
MEDCGKNKKNELENLYKYCDTKAAKAILLNSTIRFSHPSFFNDPYDAVPPHDVINGDEKLSKDFLNELANNNTVMNSFSQNNLVKIKQEIKEGTYSDLNKAKKNITYECLSKIYESMGILCLSEKKDNILMWSHYADSHKGLVIAFNSNSYLFRSAIRVNYVKSRISLDPNQIFSNINNPNDNTCKKALDVFFSTKYIDWQYENELRIIKDIKSKCSDEPINEFDIIGVYLGCNMNILDEIFFINIIKTKFPSIKIYKAYTVINSFSLNFYEIACERLISLK